jgi:ubiquinone/menaquinone biosynthesis C-methylase UbiE
LILENIMSQSSVAAAARADKGEHELRYWSAVKEKETVLHNSWYEYFYTTHFGLTRDDYVGKKVLDIGCGPRGSLEWADMAAIRIGLDPLAASYQALGTDRHQMSYVAASSDAMPFPKGHFDVVCSFNSLDHVDDLEGTIREIQRVTADGGLFLLLTDVNHPPTVCEPVSFSWDIVDRLRQVFTLIEEQHYEKKAHGMYESLKARDTYDHGNPQQRYGILSAMFKTT